MHSWKPKTKHVVNSPVKMMCACRCLSLNFTYCCLRAEISNTGTKRSLSDEGVVKLSAERDEEGEGARIIESEIVIQKNDQLGINDNPKIVLIKLNYIL